MNPDRKQNLPVKRKSLFHKRFAHPGQARQGQHDPIRRWSPTPAIRISGWCHVAGLAGVCIFPNTWPWVLAVLMGNHIVLGLAGLWPRSRLLGPNMVRLPESAVKRGQAAITFDDGPDPVVTPKVLDILDLYGAKASFFCIGVKASNHPELVNEILRRGHSVENHSNRHPGGFAGYGPSALWRELQAAQATLRDITGRSPMFFRAPMGLRSPLLEPVLARMGLRYVSWTRRGFDTVSQDPIGVVQCLTRKLKAGDILLLHDGSASKAPDGSPLVLSVLPVLLERLAANSLAAVSLPVACDNDPLR